MIRSVARFVTNCCRIWFHERVAPWVQLRDFLFFRQATGMRPGEFYRYQLWNRLRPIEERLAFLSHAEHRVIERALNPAASVRALNDKIHACERLVSAGVRMPATLGSIETRTQRGAKKSLVDIAQELRVLLDQGHSQGVVIKPNRGQAGEDVFVFLRAGSDGLEGVDGSWLSIDDAASALARRSVGLWKVEERLLPHAALARFAPNSLSTMRVLSFQSPHGVIHIGPASLKLPVDDSGVDNFHAGNLAAPVDLVTGRLGTAVRISGGARVAVHPTSGKCIEGFIVPELEAVIALVTAAATEMAELSILGWDVALTPDGPIILEGNAWWGEDIVQQPQDAGLVRGEFAELLEAHGLGDLLGSRARAVAEWRLEHPIQRCPNAARASSP